MRIKMGHTKHYNWKKKAEQSNILRRNRYDDTSEPTLTTQHVTYKITNVNTSDRYELVNVRYYEHLYENYHIAWMDFADKNGTTSLENQVRVAELPIQLKGNPMFSKKAGANI